MAAYRLVLHNRINLRHSASAFRAYAAGPAPAGYSRRQSLASPKFPEMAGFIHDPVAGSGEAAAWFSVMQLHRILGRHADRPRDTEPTSPGVS